MKGRSGATPLRCPHCGAHLPDEKRICPRCGKSPDSAPSARRAKKGEEVRPAQASPPAQHLGSGN
ncbi:MAG: zinc-ribbon domain-containing protein [Clostridia bacterium]|nr:zinc-ribbon domain-containing protein [Clostridia bacterium]